MMVIHTMLAWSLMLMMSAAAQTARPASSPEQAGGDLVALAPEHDFGSVAQGEPVVHAFIIRNRGTEPRVIERVELSAAGMNARFARTIEPGGQGTITLKWDTNSISSDVEAEAVVHFADRAVAPITLALKGRVKAPIELLPYPAVYFSVFKGETAERRVRIVNNSESALAISRLEPQGQHFAATLEPVETGRVYDLRVTLPKDVSPGRYMESVVLHTDHPKQPRLEIPVNVLVKTDVYANPEEVQFGEVSLTELQRSPKLAALLTQAVMVRKRAGTFAIKSVETSLPALVVEQEPASGASDAFRLNVGLDRDKLTAGALTGTIRILTTDKDFPELIVKVSGEAK
jgi:hypothetical protein